MRTIVTNDLETRIRTTETIKLTSKGVSSEVYTSMIGENEANELANNYEFDKQNAVIMTGLFRMLLRIPVHLYEPMEMLYMRMSME